MTNRPRECDLDPHGAAAGALLGTAAGLLIWLAAAMLLWSCA